MTPDPTVPRSRRALLAATVSAAAATVVSALGRPLSVEAADGDVVHVGALHTGDTATIFQVANTVALGGHSASGWGVGGTSDTGIGVYGQSELEGVVGESTSGPAVRGRSVDGPAVWGESQGPDWPAIVGLGHGGKTGILGISGAFDWASVAPVAAAKTGVQGYAVQDATSVGVLGGSDAGTGVRGVSLSGFGVKGDSPEGTGVKGDSESGIGVTGYCSTGLGLKGESPAGTGASGVSSAGTGVKGESQDGHGVWGSTSLGQGVRGESGDGTGVWGFSGLGCAVSGLNESSSHAAMIGRNGGNHTGVVGLSEYGPAPSFPTTVVTPPKTGVYGYAAQDTLARGVTGQTIAGRGVNGIATTGRGVHGEATTGYGSYGYATTGTAGYFATPKVGDLHTGYALRAIGRVKLDKCAGVATIASGSKSIVITPGIDLTSSSAVVASLMGSAGGTTTVHRSTVNVTANTFTIYLTAASTTNVKVAWHVFG